MKARRNNWGHASGEASPPSQVSRDDYALAALTGLASTQIPKSEQAIWQMAECAYLLADAMMKARSATYEPSDLAVFLAEQLR